jgi:hypothetical protein
VTGFFAPRALAAAAAICVVLACVYPFIGYGWHETAGLLVSAAAFAWMAHDTARIVRRNRHAQLRVARAVTLRLHEILDRYRQAS